MRALFKSSLKKLRMVWLVAARYRLIRIGANCHIGRRVHIRPGAVELGAGVFIGHECWLASSLSVGNFVLLAGRVVTVGGDHRYDVVGEPMIEAGRDVNRTIVIEDDVWVGFGAMLMHGVTIGEGSVIGAGSVVTRDVPPYSIAAGVPARVIRARFPHSSQIEQHRAALASRREELQV